MAERWRHRLHNAALAFPKYPGLRFSYGTSGFRTEASVLGSVAFRAGVLAGLRSLVTGKATGLVITASHNQATDNGVKMVDPSGGMLARNWEPFAEDIANAVDVLEVVETIIKNESVHENWKGKVLIARDTRPSGQALVAAAVKGIEAMGVAPVNMGVLTTPQLHWMVRATNKGEPQVNELAYYTKLSEAFKLLLDLNPRKPAVPRCLDIVVDGANGVGARKLLDLQMLIEGLNLEVRNSGEGELNHLAGADFVQKEKVLPAGFAASADSDRRCVTVDGDADRLAYFYVSGDGIFHLLDGDKILSLFARFLKQQVEALMGSEKDCIIPGYGRVNLGAVQTAYANGSSTKYLQEVLGLEVVLTPTGVKYLHEEAEKLDIGVYFEANGHGTVLFSERFLDFLRRESASSEILNSRLRACKRLLAVSEMVNQAIGDAISGLLMVEVVLTYSVWDVREWDALYEDVPSRQLKVKVKDRTCITTTNAETKVSRPAELQSAIDKEVENFTKGRAFVRPSGTEDVVRVYAEAGTQELADELAANVAVAVYELAGGVGPKPAKNVITGSL
ncbi:phosphoacetylglucosamine mutase [Selaginella moellendorffii]|uniref:phosphoacetylglucosamine mutase n=1 Tax=Selaginella moellendorffii TaxID=88036 RepID=UPI000D1C3517|nr:phosphoacetylglucosamine mutase [Selaginella moellendorffii]|eukprot:XP_024537107.1 phosphoacetylglucosamine mutase [Selaginella moellendorffii]